LKAAPLSGATHVTYQYRVGVTGAFVNVPTANVVTPGTTTHPTWPSAKTAGAFPGYTWDVPATVGTGPALVQVQACYGISASDPAPACSVPANIELDATAFGDSYSTSDLGPGTLADLTGDYQLTATDVDVPTYLGSLSVSRSLTTLAPPGERTDAGGIFGPGWTASLPTPDAGAAELSLTDHIAQGYVEFRATDGSTARFQANTPDAGATYVGVGDAAAWGWTVTANGANTQITVTDAENTVTTWVKTGTRWDVTTVAQTGSNGTTAYTRDTAGRITRIVGPVPAGITCTNPDTTPGCRSLTFTYTTITVAGTTLTRLGGVNYVAYNPQTSAMATVPVASYSYDSTGRLAAAWDPRITPNLKTTYTYAAQGRITALTPPGLAPWTFGYDATGRLSTISRPDPSGANAVQTVVYDVPISGTAAPVQLDATTAAAWAQTGDLPAAGTAIFPATHNPTGTTPSALTSADWPCADLTYLDVNGRPVNTAAYGAGAWQIDTTQYNETGSPTWNLSAGNRAQAVTPSSTYTDPSVVAMATSTDRANALATTTSYDPLDASKVTGTLGPIHPVKLANGSVVDARTHRTTSYDEGNPADGTTVTGLDTTNTSSAQTLDGLDHDTVTTHLGYGAVTSGDTTGWTLGRPTTNTVQMGSAPSSADLVTTTRYNSAGQIIESRLPGGAAGSTAQSTVTTYYTATGIGTCVDPAAAGMVCTTKPAAQPTGQLLPTVAYTYTMDGQVTTKAETAGSTVRTTINTYDTAGRLAGSTVTATPAAAGGTPIPAVAYSYDTVTGLPTTWAADSRTLTTGYDSLGQATSYTDATGNLTTTAYDLAGRVASVGDGKGTTTYTYDTATEHRGLVTGENVGAGTAPSTFTATYNPAGQVESVTYPNGLAAWYHYDNNDTPTTLVYAKGGNTWLSYLAVSNATGRMAEQGGSAGDQTYTYDQAGRLTTVQDTQVNSATTATCTTRVYAYDRDSNRGQVKSYPDSAGGGSANGSCSVATTPTLVTSTFDAADRISNIGYSYDALGRTLTIPAADAISTGSKASITGSLTIGYYANDMIASQTQGGATRAYTLDPALNRIASISDGTTTLVNHYSDPTDSPTWTSTGAGWTRNLLGPDGGFVGTQTDTGTVTLQLANLHGDIVATANDDPAAATASAQFSTTEYGQPETTSNAPETYGWLGTHQRSTQPLGGLILMGVRLYNPITDRFLTPDPIPGGNANPYLYPTDPINQYDLNGTCWSWINWACKAAAATGRGIANAGRWVGGRATAVYNYGRGVVLYLVHARWVQVASGFTAIVQCGSFFYGIYRHSFSLPSLAACGAAIVVLIK
jgi:RHS repeat-associated protein